MDDARRVVVDVKDADGTWWRAVEAYRDGAGALHLPAASVGRLGGEFDGESGGYWLADGLALAEPSEVIVGGEPVAAYRVGHGLRTRAARGVGAKGGA